MVLTAKLMSERQVEDEQQKPEEDAVNSPVPCRLYSFTRVFLCGLGFLMILAPDIHYMKWFTAHHLEPAVLALVTTPNATERRCLPNPHRTVPIFGSECPSDSHYCFDNKGVTHWEPVPQCFLPPPQPFWIADTAALTKALGMCLVFWVSLANRKVNKMKERAVIALTLGSVTLSTLLLIWKAFWMETATFWQHSQCWGIILSTAPWIANVVLYWAKYLSMNLARSVMDGVTGYWEGISDDEYESYQGSWFYHKRATASLIIKGTVAASVVFNGFFGITNLLPGAVAYFYLFVPLYVCRSVFMHCVRYPEEGAPLRDPEGGIYIQNWEKKVNYWPVVLVPLAIIADNLVQFLATTTVYWYQGIGYIQAAWMSATERQSSIYMENFESQILAAKVWAMELWNEAMP